MAIVEEANKKSENDNDIEPQPLIPGLPDEVAELCLLCLPYPYHSLLRSVSSSWNRAITHPSFLHSKQLHSRSLSRPHLFVFAFHKPTSTIQCQALDPSSSRWFLLPRIPFPLSFATASLPRQGKLFIFTNTTTLVYTAAANQWSPATAPPSPAAKKSPFAAEGVDNGRIVTVGGNGMGIYDAESDTWRAGAGLGEDELARYEVAAVKGKVYVTEGWQWPFTVGPRGWVYDCGCDTWRVMGKGMREGWTGVAVGVGGRVFVIAEYGECPVKVYDEESDTWRHVGGDRFPREVMRRPFAVRGLEERIYVVSCGLNVAIGSVVVCDDHEVRVRWEVVEAPEAFCELSPWNCQVLYA